MRLSTLDKPMILFPDKPSQFLNLARFTLNSKPTLQVNCILYNMIFYYFRYNKGLNFFRFMIFYNRNSCLGFLERISPKCTTLRCLFLQYITAYRTNFGQRFQFWQFIKFCKACLHSRKLFLW